MNHCIILARPETSANIGAVCRAMATGNLHDLRIIGTRSEYDESVIERIALQAFPLWQSARFFEPSVAGLQEAVSDTEIVFGTTRRTGKKRTAAYRNLADTVQNIFEKGYTKAAFVFGNERTGLSEQELALCNISVYIPTAENFGSLNLSHAVQIVSYELFQYACAHGAEQAEKSFSPPKVVPQQTIEKLSAALLDTLLTLDFFRMGGADENEKFFRNILTRAELNEFEAEHIAALLEKCSMKLKNKMNRREGK